MQSALFVGRFQPFHKGHLQVVQEILKKNERVIIVIGSAEDNYLPDNPLTAAERFVIIEEALKEAKIKPEKYCIIPVRNVNNFALWVNHINTYVPPYTCLYTGSEIVKACYLGKYNRSHEAVKPGPKIFDLQRKLKICATDVRMAMLKGKGWEKFVPKSVARKLKEWEVPMRLNIIKKIKPPRRPNEIY